ncbi:MAG: hypothetical protein HZB68_00415 [Candidatus Aenigmarchaeota archaeon]|nr:hypothetical protein [Candidatus Aenigmarchaeota archaeon]
MLENLWFKEEEEKKFLQIYLFSAFFTVVSIFLTKTLLPFSEGLVSVFMVSLAAAYPTIRFLKEDEEEEISKRYSEGKLLDQPAILHDTEGRDKEDKPVRSSEGHGFRRNKLLGHSPE